MSNLPILYFTLGMLAGLPVGYGLGWLTDPKQVVAYVVRVVWDLRGLDKRAQEVMLSIVAVGAIKEAA